MFENIEVNRANFCVGPQAGTFCTVDNEVSPVVMHVKNNSGVLIRTYIFSPQDTLDTGPYTYSATFPEIEDPQFNEFVTIQYVGPYNQSSYYDGAVFYTLEKHADSRREYYTYAYPDVPLTTATRVEYSGNVIRRWLLDETSFRLILDRTFIKTADTTDWFGSDAFCVQHTLTTFDAHSPAGTGQIEVTTTSGLTKYDVLLLGPSTDTSNLGEIEEVYVDSISGNTVDIKTYSGDLPTVWEYVSGDSITFFRDIYLFSNPRPLIEVSTDIAYAYASTSGTLYKLGQADYGTVIGTYYSGLFADVFAATWNNYFYTLSFIKGYNLLHMSIDDQEVARSQDMHIEDPYTFERIPVYDIDIEAETIYKLQTSIAQHDGAGQYIRLNWNTYNYHEDTFLPYTNSVTLRVDDRILLKQGQAFITTIVRDQFGVGLLSKNVWFSANGDINGVITPLDGYRITDANGLASIQYDAGNLYTGTEVISVVVDGGNSIHGSSNVGAATNIEQYHEFWAESRLVTYIDTSTHTSLRTVGSVNMSVQATNVVAYTFPGNMLDDNDMDGWEARVEDMTSIIFTVSKLLFHDNDDSNVPISINDLMFNRAQHDTDTQRTIIYIKELLQNEKQLSANFVSRHLLQGHTADISLNQYVFVQDVRPTMWSEKNNVDTDFWIRLRPFAASLNPSTLVIKLREESYLGNATWVDVTALGVITMFDAGGGILGIDFLYVPPQIFHHNAIVRVDIEVYDTAVIPNIITLKYWFKIAQDYKAPYLDKLVPAVEAYNVVVNTPITFDIIDEGEGTDITTLEVFVNQRSTTFTYDEYEPGNFHIICILTSSFNYGERVVVDVIVFDKSDNTNRLLDGWKFYCVDSSGPWINMDNVEPSLCVEGEERTQPVSVQIYGTDDTGIKYDSIRIEAGGKYRNLKIVPIVYRLS